MQRVGKLVAILAMVLVAAGCQTYYKQFDLEAWPSAIERSIKQSSARYVVADGSWVFMDGPVDFGDAICGSTICVQKADIRSVHFSEGHEGLSSPEFILAAPIYLIATFGMIQPTVNDGHKLPLPTIAELMPVCSRSIDPVPSQRALETEQSLADWVWENQHAVRPDCLYEASLRFSGEDVRKGVGLRMLSFAKSAWAFARCKDAQIGFPIIPTRGDRVTAGDPDWIRWAREIIADPRTYADDVRPGFCDGFGGMLPTSEWEDRKRALIPRLDPFSREPFIYYGALARKIPPEDDPHPLHNHRVPSIAKP